MVLYTHSLSIFRSKDVFQCSCEDSVQMALLEYVRLCGDACSATSTLRRRQAWSQDSERSPGHFGEIEDAHEELGGA